MKIDYICVVNHHEQYDSYYTNNPYVNKHNIIIYNNIVENLPITLRYNDYIENKMKDDTWCVFLHQDFEFNEDIADKLGALPTNSIYGPIGAKAKKSFIIFIRLEWFKWKKLKIALSKRSLTVGGIKERQGDKIIEVGKRVSKPVLVDTVDCCCLIVHSSLIKEYNLKFDENLQWHLYSEEFSLNAKISHGIQTKVIQLEGTHYSCGSFNPMFQYSLLYLRNKYNNKPFASTCFDGYNFFLKNKL
jgi:hypothetical protein